ncbi:MAG: type II toxin-antitoxin system RelE/ParE family toxin [Nanoarchaeota archaeon]
MAYGIDYRKGCRDKIEKLCKKDPVLKEALRKKINEILDFPYHYKPLKYDLAGERRVHVMGSFVLKFKIDETSKTVKFLFFGHHDNAYRR